MVPTTGSPAASNDPEDAPTDLPKSSEKAAKMIKKSAKSSKNLIKLINFGKKEKDLKKDLPLKGPESKKVKEDFEKEMEKEKGVQD